MAKPAPHEGNVDRSIADYLVGDARARARGVTGLTLQVSSFLSECIGFIICSEGSQSPPEIVSGGCGRRAPDPRIPSAAGAATDQIRMSLRRVLEPSRQRRRSKPARSRTGAPPS